MTTPVVSGPGSLSRRTDTGPAQKIRELPDAEYGEAATYRDLQQGAPLAQDPGARPTPQVNVAAQNVVPLSAPSQDPNTPVTDGASAGPGLGIEALGLTSQRQQDLQKYLPYLPVFEYMANQEGASWAARNLVRELKTMV